MALKKAVDIKAEIEIYFILFTFYFQFDGCANTCDGEPVGEKQKYIFRQIEINLQN